MGLLEIAELTVEFGTLARPFRAVDGVTLAVDEGELVGIVGESGSGKSVAMLAVMGLIAFPGRVRAGRLAFHGRDLLGMGARERRRLVGKDMAMVFQEPMTSLNPCFSVGFQIEETLREHEGLSRGEARLRAAALLRRVGIPDPETRLSAYPHQLSGGMCQRVMIAMAIACNPKLLIADEPTTALDVTIQKQILDLLLELQRERGMALVLITHDMGVIAETVDRVVVMYAGQMVEEQPVGTLFERPRHPYTSALLDALPERSIGRARLPTIAGVVPGQYDRPHGCLFHPRCAFADARCRAEVPRFVARQSAEAPGEGGGSGGAVRCHWPLAAPGGQG